MNFKNTLNIHLSAHQIFVMALTPDWESLPNSILDSILDDLVSVEDCIRFRLCNMAMRRRREFSARSLSSTPTSFIDLEEHIQTHVIQCDREKVL